MDDKSNRIMTAKSGEIMFREHAVTLVWLRQIKEDKK